MNGELTPFTLQKYKPFEGPIDNNYVDFQFHHEISFDTIGPQYYLTGKIDHYEDDDDYAQQPIPLFEPVWTLSWAADFDQRFCDYNPQPSFFKYEEQQPDDVDTSKLPEIKIEPSSPQNIPIKQQDYGCENLNINDFIILTTTGRVTRKRLQEFLSTSPVNNRKVSNTRSKRSKKVPLRELHDCEQNINNVKSDSEENFKVQVLNQLSGIKKGIYKCGHCQEGFNRLGNFYAHVRKVGAPRPFKCTVQSCPWSVIGFLNKNECNRHIKHQHSGATFQCQLGQCRKAFVRLDSKNRHQRLVHGYHGSLAQ